MKLCSQAWLQLQHLMSSMLIYIVDNLLSAMLLTRLLISYSQVSDNSPFHFKFSPSGILLFVLFCNVSIYAF